MAKSIKNAHPSADGIPVHCRHTDIIATQDLRCNPTDPNSHSQKQVLLLAKKLQEDGWREPIIVCKESGQIVAGHGKRLAAIHLGLREVPVEIQEFEPNEEKTFLISDNQIKKSSELDQDILRDIVLNDLNEDDEENGLLGFEPQELEEILHPSHEDIDPGHPAGPRPGLGSGGRKQLALIYAEKDYQEVLGLIKLIQKAERYKSVSGAVIAAINGYANA